MSVQKVETLLPDTSIVIYDLSTPILDMDPTFTITAAHEFTVVTACGRTMETLEEVVPIGVIPTSQYGEEIRNRALAGDFDVLLSECDS